MTRSLPLRAMDLGLEMETVPAWMSVCGRGTYQGLSLPEVKKGASSAEDLRLVVSASGVQEVYAARCRRLVEEFLGFVEKQKEKGCFGVVSILVARFAAELLLRRDIRRSSTIRSYLTEVTRCWPSALKAPEVQEFMRGLETLSPALPEAAGVTLARSCGRFAAGVWMRREIGLNNGYSVAIVAGLMAGLRVREAARMLMRKDGFRCSEEGLVAWREDCATKTNMRGWRYLPERVAEVPLEVAPTLSRLALPWSADDKEVRRVIAATIGALVKAGFPRDVRVFRRMMAVQVRDQRLTEGDTEEQAQGWARQALGHLPGSTTTFRYLGGALSQPGQRKLAKAQTKSNV